jgi:hypothetical protein
VVSGDGIRRIDSADRDDAANLDIAQRGERVSGRGLHLAELGRSLLRPYWKQLPLSTAVFFTREFMSRQMTWVAAEI